MAALRSMNSEMFSIEQDRPARIPFKIEPISTLNPVFPGPPQRLGMGVWPKPHA